MLKNYMWPHGGHKVHHSVHALAVVLPTQTVSIAGHLNLSVFKFLTTERTHQAHRSRQGRSLGGCKTMIKDYSTHLEGEKVFKDAPRVFLDENVPPKDI